MGKKFTATKAARKRGGSKRCFMKNSLISSKNSRRFDNQTNSQVRVCWVFIKENKKTYVKLPADNDRHANQQ